MRGILGLSRFDIARTRASTAAAASDALMGEIDAGNARNGTLILQLDMPVNSDMNDIQVWTSSQSDFGTSGTALTAVASDGLRQVELSSDDSNLWAAKSDGTVLTSHFTVASNTIASVSDVCTIALNLKNIGRYVRVQYNSQGTGGQITQTFIGHDLAEAPWAGARSAY